MTPNKAKSAKQSPGSGFRQKCRSYLNKRWDIIQHEFQLESPDSLGNPLNEFPDLVDRIHRAITSKTLTYRYVLPTQLLAKAVDPSLNCLVIQVGARDQGAFDARSLAHHVIVPFDQANHKVLGGSTSPYINNPLRVSGFFAEHRAAQKDKAGWDNIVYVLEEVESSPDSAMTAKVFDQVLYAIRRQLETVVVVYPTPSRISLDNTLSLLRQFATVRSGGDRLEAVVTALFRTLASHFDLFTEVRRTKVNAADKSSRMVADIECLIGERIALLVEVKDRILTLVELEGRLEAARSRQITEILYITRGPQVGSESERIDAIIASEFTSGQNVYSFDYEVFVEPILALLGEEGRRGFLVEMGRELDRTNSAIENRRSWANLLRSV